MQWLTGSFGVNQPHKREEWRRYRRAAQDEEILTDKWNDAVCLVTGMAVAAAH